LRAFDPRGAGNWYDVGVEADEPREHDLFDGDAASGCDCRDRFVLREFLDAFDAAQRTIRDQPNPVVTAILGDAIS